MENVIHPTHGISIRLEEGDELHEKFAELKVNGYTVIDSGISQELIGELHEELSSIYGQQCREIGGEEKLLKIKDSDIVRCALSYSKKFLDVATNKALLSFCNRVFGTEFVLLQQNGIMNRPGRDNYQVKWHRDISYQHWTSSKPLAINALLCLDQFTHENGATFVLPGTHHIVEFPTNRFVTNWEKQMSVPAGSFLVLDAMLYHRAGVNRSSGVRFAVNHLIGLPFMAQQVDLRSAISRVGAVECVEEQHRGYLGYRWTPAEDALNWRLRRL